MTNICHVLNVVVFSWGDSPASEFYVPTFQNTLVCSIVIGCFSRKNNRGDIARVFIQVNLVQVILPAYTTYEDGTDRVFRNVGT
jgi:hypothetical protein